VPVSGSSTPPATHSPSVNLAGSREGWEQGNGTALPGAVAESLPDETVDKPAWLRVEAKPYMVSGLHNDAAPAFYFDLRDLRHWIAATATSDKDKITPNGI
jgi:hypothetical protein